MKAGKCASGSFACEKMVKSGRARLVIIDGGMSESSKKSVKDMCSYYEVPIITADPPGEIARALGKPGKKAFAINDDNFAKKLLDIYNECKEQAEV